MKISPLIKKIILSDFIKTSTRWKYLKFLGYEIEKSIIEGGLSIVGNKLSIQEGTYINKNVYIECHEQVTIGKNVLIAPGVKILTGTHNIEASGKIGDTVHKQVTVEDNVWLAANSLILPGIKIGKNCIIAAGAVVVKSCQPGYLYAGVPAKKVRKINET